MSFHGGLLGVLMALAFFARRRAQARRRRLRFRVAIARHRLRRRAHRQLHQRRALGQGDRRAVGGRRRRHGAAPVAALRGRARGPRAVRDPVVVHVAAAAIAGRHPACSWSVTASSASPSSSCACPTRIAATCCSAGSRWGRCCRLPMIVDRPGHAGPGLSRAASRPATRSRAEADAAVPRPDAPRARARRPQGRSHRHRHALRVRLPDALRPRRGFPAGHDQEAAPEVDRPRAAVVPARRHQRALPARERRDDLGRVGGRGGRARSRLRRAVALLAPPPTAARSTRSRARSS